MESPVICSTCLSWQMKYPCGVCRHPNAEGLTTSNEMVFHDAGKLCPKNALKYRLERLKDTKSIIEELSKEINGNLSKVFDF